MERIIRRTMLVLAAMALSFSPAMAQTQQAPNCDSPAVVTHESTNPTALVEGANCFTEDQAKSRIEEAGYTTVSDLKLDDKGLWRGTAMKDGASVSVAMDYQGNVTSE